jgi:hypothetical protein
VAKTTLKTVSVATTAEMHNAMNQYMSKGFVVSSQTADMTTLNKTPLLTWTCSEIAAVMGLVLLCIAPGIYYYMVVTKRHNTIEQVVIRVDPAAAAPQSPPT